MDYNNTAYNSWTYWTGAIPISVIWDNFILDWFWIHNHKFYVINKRDIFRTDLQSFDYPVSNWKWYVSNYYRWRTIELDMIITCETAWEFNELLDLMRWKLARNNVELKEKINWEYRTIRVTTTNLPLNKQYYNITYLPFTVTFEALEPFWYDEKFTVASYLDTTTDIQEEIVNEWNVEVDPIIRYVFKSATGTTFVKAEISSFYIQVNETFNAWDVLEIDCKEKEVKLNWVIVDYDWTFPEIETDSNIVKFSSNWTYNVDINILYQKNYK